MIRLTGRKQKVDQLKILIDLKCLNDCLGLGSWVSDWLVWSGRQAILLIWTYTINTGSIGSRAVIPRPHDVSDLKLKILQHR
jgi:hypothetical protein